MTAKPLDLAQFEGHTLLPWSIVGDNAECKVVRAGNGIVSHIARLNTQWMCEEHGGEVFKNARLIAAAPALLAECRRLQASERALRDALEAMLTRCDKLTGIQQLKFGPHIMQARAALKVAS